MADITTALKAEISRVARKELRSELDALRKTGTHYRAEIAALKRRIEQLERQAKQKTKSKAQDDASVASSDQDGEVKLRFRASGFASLREKLGISAEAMGQLVGVTGQSIYKWEAGKAAPRRSQLPAIAAIRKLGKREVLARLESLAQTE